MGYDKTVTMKFKPVCKVLLYAMLTIASLSLGSFAIVKVSEHIRQAQLELKRNKKSYTMKEMKEDLDYFKSMLKSVHPEPFFSISEQELDAEIWKIKAKINKPKSHKEFYRLFAAILSRLNDEHIYIKLLEYELHQYDQDNGRYFPFDVKIINGHCFISNKYISNSDITTGMEILSINNIKIDEILSVLVQYFSGRSLEQTIYYCQQSFKEILYLVYDIGDNIDLKILNLEENQIYNYSIKGKRKQELSIAKKPSYAYQIFPEKNIILLRFNSFKEEAGNSFKAFLKEMFTAIKDHHINNLIIDMRDNTGGASVMGNMLLEYLTNKTFSQMNTIKMKVNAEVKKQMLHYIPAFIRWLPVQYIHPQLQAIWTAKEGTLIDLDPSFVMEREITPKENELRFQGNLFVIIGPGTMSSSCLFAATVQHYNIGVLAGENTGGFTDMYANMWQFNLPNSAMPFYIPNCILNSYGKKPVLPNYKVKQSYNHILNNKDTVVEFIIDKLIR